MLARLPVRLFVVWVAAVVAFGAVLGVLQVAITPVSDLTVDVADSAGMPPWTGALSTLGFVLWGSAAVLCATVAAAIRRRDRARSTFLIATAALLTLLLIDDALLIHERIGPDDLGFPEKGFYVIYAALAGAWVVRFRDEVLRADAWLLFLAGGSLAASVLIDASDALPIAADDFPKLVGLATLLAFAIREALSAMQPTPVLVPAPESEVTTTLATL